MLWRVQLVCARSKFRWLEPVELPWYIRSSALQQVLHLPLASLTNPKVELWRRLRRGSL
jgi:hypothetical protein